MIVMEGSVVDDVVNGSYIVIKALENGVYIAQFTEITSAIKIKGKAEVFTNHGKIVSGTLLSD